MINKKTTVYLTLSISGVFSLLYYFLSNPSLGNFLIFWVIAFGISYLHLHYFFYLYLHKKVRNFSKILTLEDEDHDIIPNQYSLHYFEKELEHYVEKVKEEIERLKQLEHFRKEFLADISHELKTPLFAAQGFVHTLLDGAINDKKIRNKFLKKAARSLDGLDILVQDLLTISQMESGEIKMRFENFDIIALCTQVIDQMEGKIEKKNMHIVIENPSKKTLYVYADYQRIFQVLSNLLSNSIKYSKKGAQVSISFEKSKTGIICNVTDQGIGIPPNDLNRIFERFYRVDKSRSKERGGTGLGLAIVKHIMEGHGERVSVKSEMGKGSTFSFELRKGLRIKSETTKNYPHDAYEVA